MKKLFLFIITLCIVPLISQAISTNDIQQHPEKYIFCGSNKHVLGYYTPTKTRILYKNYPFYTIQTTDYMINYQLEKIYESTVLYQYRITNGQLTITSTTLSINSYTLDGDPVYSGNTTNRIPSTLKAGMIGWYIGETIFYDQFFLSPQHYLIQLPKQ